MLLQDYPLDKAGGGLLICLGGLLNFWNKMATPTPIIMIHRHDSFYLPYTIGQARQSNPHNPIILLGDDATRGYHGVQHFHLKHYFKQARELERRFGHLEATGKKWEIQCFQRWLVLHEFMAETGWDRFLHLDSDVLLFRPAEEIVEAFARHPVSFSWHPVTRKVQSGDFIACGHGAVFTSRQPLDEIAERCLATLEHFQARVDQQPAGMPGLRLHTPTGVTDMNALGDYVRRHPDTTGNTCALEDPFLLDHSVLQDEGRFQMEGGMKKLVWKNDLPHGVLHSGQEIPFALLHCQGHAKYAMHRLMRVTDPRLRREMKQDLLRARWRKFQEKLPRWMQAKTGF